MVSTQVRSESVCALVLDERGYIAFACFSARSPMKGNLYICP
jgi:hypothetical protein